MSLGLSARCEDCQRVAGSSAPWSPVCLSAVECSGSESSGCPSSSEHHQPVTGASAHIPSRVSKTTCMRCSAWPRMQWGPMRRGPMTSTCCTQESKATPLLTASQPRSLWSCCPLLPRARLLSLSHAWLGGGLHPAHSNQGQSLLGRCLRLLAPRGAQSPLLLDWVPGFGIHPTLAG